MWINPFRGIFRCNFLLGLTPSLKQWPAITRSISKNKEKEKLTRRYTYK